MTKDQMIAHLTLLGWVPCRVPKKFPALMRGNETITRRTRADWDARGPIYKYTDWGSRQHVWAPVLWSDIPEHHILLMMERVPP